MSLASQVTAALTRIGQEVKAKPTLVEYTTVVPARPSTGSRVIWQGQVDPGANALAGDSWWPTA